MELEELRDQLAAVIVESAQGLQSHLQEMEERLLQNFDRLAAGLERHEGMNPTEDDG